MVKKHVAFAPASQKQLGSRLRSPLLRRETVPAQPFSRFFHRTAFAKQGTRKRGQATFSLTKNGACPHFLAIMFERSELRSRREERMENGVKNLKGARPVIIVTAVYKGHQYRNEALRTFGVSDYYEKPYDQDKLVNRVLSLIGEGEEVEEDISEIPGLPDPDSVIGTLIEMLKKK